MEKHKRYSILGASGFVLERLGLFIQVQLGVDACLFLKTQILRI